MANVEALVLQMSADITRMEKALNQARGQTNRQLGLVEQRFDKFNAHVRRSGDQMAGDFRRSIATIGSALALRDIADAADRWTNLRNQVRQYADVLGPVGVSTDRLTAIANDAGVAVDSLGETMAASARAAKTLGASADDVFAFNEAVAKGSAIANTGVAAVDGALRQLGQSIGSPKVQLGEFNSIIEGTPRLAQAFADGVDDANGSVSRLRELISKGEISGTELFQGLLTQLPKLRAEFAQTEQTISRSTARLQNAFLQYVGGADQASGATKTLSGFIDIITNNFDSLADAAVLAASVLGGALAVGAIIKLGASLKTMSADAAVARTALQRLSVAATFFGGPAGAAILAIGAALAVLAIKATAAKSPFENLYETIGKLKGVRENIATDTQKLADLNVTLRDAMESQALAAETTARREIAAVDDRIRKNKELATAYEAQIAAQNATLHSQHDSTRKGHIDRMKRFLRPDDVPAGPDDTLPERLLAEVRRRQDAGQELSATIQAALVNLDQLNRYELQLASSDSAVADLRKWREEDAKDPNGTRSKIAALPKLSGDANALTDATASVAGYRTELELLTKALADLSNANRRATQGQTALQTFYDDLVNADLPDDTCQTAPEGDPV
jgi:tape measure domain-containing protein